SNKIIPITEFVLVGSDAGNYVVKDTSQTQTTASITAREITVSGIAAEDKNYNGNTTATLSYANAVLSGKIQADDLSVTATGTFDSKNAGESKSVQISLLTLAGEDAGNYVLAADGQQEETTATIFRQAIVVSGIQQGSTQSPYVKKTYDGTTSITMTYFNRNNIIYTGLVSGETLTVTFTATLDNKYPGENKTAYLSDFVLGGDYADNYVLAAEGQQTEVTGLVVTQRHLDAGANGLTASSSTRVYTGGTEFIFYPEDYVGFAWYTGSSGPCEGDDVRLDYIVWKVANKNVGQKSRNTSAGNSLTFYLTGADAMCYNAGPKAGYSYLFPYNFTIVAKTVSVTGITASDKSYDGTVFAQIDVSNAVLLGLIADDDVSLTNDGTSGTFADAGIGENKIVTITGFSLSGEDAGNYSLNPCQTTASISPKALKIKSGVTASNKTYNGTTDVVLDATNVVITGLVGEETVTVTAAGAFADANVGADKTVNITGFTLSGEYSAHYTIAANGNQTTATATISPKEITITADDKTSVYGDALASLTATLSVDLIAGDDASTVYTLTKEAGLGKGSYVITVNVVTNDNYTVTAVNGTYTISAKAITITANDKSSTYGDEFAVLTATLSTDLAPGDSANAVYTLTKAAGVTVGSYEITVTGINQNYDVTPVNGTYTINAKVITVTADDKSTTYGDALAALTATLSAELVAGDSADAVYTLTKADGVNKGTYAITVGVVANDNYSVTAVNGTYTINAKEITVMADNKSTIYGEALADLTATLSAELVTGDNADDVYTLTKAAGVNKGSYVITVNVVANDNYKVTAVNGTYTINAKEITVTADDKSSTYGDALAVLTATLSTDLVTGDSADSVYTLTKAEGSNKGAYVITVTGINQNYDLTAVNGTYTINAKEITVTADDKSTTYGDALAPLTATLSAGLVAGDNADDVYTLTKAAGVNKGSYVITVNVVTNDNYKVTAVNGTYTINAKAITVTADNKFTTYGDALAALTATLSVDLVSGDSADDVYTLTKEEGADKGAYTITVNVVANDNYTVTAVNGTYIITVKPITVTADDKSSTYGDALAALTATLSAALVTGDTADEVYTLTKAAGANKGTYAITVNVVANDNYKVTAVNGTYTINARPITITADSKSLTYGAVLLPLTATLSEDLVAGDNAADVYTLTREEGTNVGSYAITVIGINQNYDVTAVAGTYTINAKNIAGATVNLDDSEFVYNGSDQTKGVLSVVIDGMYVTYTTSGNVQKHAGDYTLTVSGNGNFTGEATADWSIARKTIVPELWIGNDQQSGNTYTKTYDGEAIAVSVKAFNAEANEFVLFQGNSDKVTVADSGSYAVQAGNYATLPGGDALDYCVESSVTFTWTINAREITVTADDKSSTYGDALASLTATLSTDLGAGDSADDVYTLTKAEGADKGTYAITVNVVANDNYSVTAVNGTYTINAKNIAGATVTLAETSLVFNGYTQTAEVSSVVIDGLTATYTTSGNVQVHAGNYALTVSGNGNFTGTATADWAISPRTLTAYMMINGNALSGNRKDASFVYDGVERTFLVRGAFINDVVVFATETLTDVGSGRCDVEAGDYAADGAHNDYHFEAATFTWEITKADYDMSGVTFEDAAKQYTGAAQGLTIGGTLPTGLDGVQVTVSYDGAATNVSDGAVKVTATFATTSPNYNAPAKKEAYVTITKATFDVSGVTFADATYTYDGSARSILIGAALNDEISVSYEGNGQTNVGTYPVTAKFTVSNNYNAIDNMTATLTITKARYDMTGVTFANVDVVYDGAAKTAVIAGNLPAGVTVAYANNTLTDVGAITATATFTGDSDNYEAIADMTATITIAKATYDMTGIVFADVTATYDGQAHVAVISGNLPTGVTVAYRNNSRTDVGAQTATATFAGNANYNAIADMTATILIKAAVTTDEEGKAIKTYEKGFTAADLSSEEGVSVKELFATAQADASDETTEKNVKITVDNAEAGVVTIVFDAAAIDAIAGLNSADLRLSVVSGEGVAAMEKESLKGAEMVISISLAEEAVAFGENGQATLSFDFDKKAPKGMVGKVYYVDANGNRTDMKAAFDGGKVTFSTGHFSDYIVVFEKEGKGLSGGAIAGIVIGCVAFLALAAFGVIFFLRKKGILAK
ncbi:MAG: hypothetical protein J5774_01300, partial [Clostridia bacterium]|nr:hypothetical protein [Clostridia bacterium]